MQRFKRTAEYEMILGKKKNVNCQTTSLLSNKIVNKIVLLEQ